MLMIIEYFVKLIFDNRKCVGSNKAKEILKNWGKEDKRYELLAAVINNDVECIRKHKRFWKSAEAIFRRNVIWCSRILPNSEMEIFKKEVNKSGDLVGKAIIMFACNYSNLKKSEIYF